MHSIRFHMPIIGAALLILSVLPATAAPSFDEAKFRSDVPERLILKDIGPFRQVGGGGKSYGGWLCKQFANDDIAWEDSVFYVATYSSPTSGIVVWVDHYDKDTMVAHDVYGLLLKSRSVELLKKSFIAQDVLPADEQHYLKQRFFWTSKGGYVIKVEVKGEVDAKATTERPDAILLAYLEKYPSDLARESIGGSETRWMTDEIDRRLALLDSNVADHVKSRAVGLICEACGLILLEEKPASPKMIRRIREWWQKNRGLAADALRASARQDNILSSRAKVDEMIDELQKADDARARDLCFCLGYATGELDLLTGIDANIHEPAGLKKSKEMWAKWWKEHREAYEPPEAKERQEEK